MNNLQKEFERVTSRLKLSKERREMYQSLDDLKEKVRERRRVVELLSERIGLVEESILKANRGRGSLETMVQSEKELLRGMGGMVDDVDEDELFEKRGVLADLEKWREIERGKQGWKESDEILRDMKKVRSPIEERMFKMPVRQEGWQDKLR